MDDTTLKESICRKIKSLRKKHSYSQEEVAVLLNMGQNTYSQLESGKTKIDIERLQQIADFYKISVHDFLCGITPPQPRNISKGLSKFCILNGL